MTKHRFMWEPLPRAEVIKAIERQNPRRIPMVRAKWWGEGLEEQYGNQLSDFDSYPEDVKDLWLEPPIDYAKMGLSWKLPAEEGAHDSRPILDDWAKLDEFIEKLPEGYQTDVRERGGRLSVGQRQLISLARALLADPRILIMDEATSSIDAYTELIIQQALDRIFKNRTSIIIAHRLSTVRNSDMIIVLEKGQIAEKGSHQELIRQGGLYKQLYEMQFKYETEEEPEN